ncbi:hypothetical protein T492DRAFT_353039 [Pavlovales sp. CCMP2436]|nr:hypothetical protein T492DRAFT_353039 [Pavlovales sp. CCMP2436]
MDEFFIRSARAKADPTAPCVYLQSSLVEGVGAQIVNDFKQFDWAWAKSLSTPSAGLGWGALTRNVLFVGSRGHTTPAHFDEQQNLLAQLSGRKRVLLWRPSDWTCLYPHPVLHPCDRQSSLDFKKGVDLTTRPRFQDAQAFEAILEPGEVLYIPQYWWHRVENLDDDCVTVNFWYIDVNARNITVRFVCA